MKRIILFAVFILCIVSTACAQYQTNVLSSTNTAVKLRCTGYAKNKKKALAEAELAAIKAVLFHGIDNTQSQTALIPTTEQEAMKKQISSLSETLTDTRSIAEGNQQIADIFFRLCPAAKHATQILKKISAICWLSPAMLRGSSRVQVSALIGFCILSSRRRDT